VVAGATRGAGRGIAAALGEAGATVICTGRSSSAGTGAIRSDYDRVETIEETAELVSALGGVGRSDDFYGGAWLPLVERERHHTLQALLRNLTD
jgi:NAD(P)-dependent dehydrogenase (short-subunit alcohol dehydrogenase family)